MEIHRGIGVYFTLCVPLKTLCALWFKKFKPLRGEGAI